LVAALRFQIGDEFGRFGGAAAALLRRDICERGLDVPRRSPETIIKSRV
jgi:hypothetical protein